MLNSLLKLDADFQAEKQFCFYTTKKLPIILHNGTFVIKSNSVFDKTKHLHTMQEAIYIFINKSRHKNSSSIKGIAYFCTGGNYGVLDLDNAFIEGKTLRYLFKRIVANVEDSYVEYSMSKKGLHILVKKDMKLIRNYTSLVYRDITTKDSLYLPGDKAPGLEVYIDVPKILALTGLCYNGHYNITYSTSNFARINNYLNTVKEKKPDKNLVLPTTKVLGKGTFLKDKFSVVEARVTLEAVVMYYAGIHITDKLQHCPFHSQTKNKSFKLMPGNSTRYICHSSFCNGGKEASTGGRTGNIFDFVVAYKSLAGLSEAADLIIKDFLGGKL